MLADHPRALNGAVNQLLMGGFRVQGIRHGMECPTSSKSKDFQRLRAAFPHTEKSVGHFMRLSTFGSEFLAGGVCGSVSVPVEQTIIDVQFSEARAR